MSTPKEWKWYEDQTKRRLANQLFKKMQTVKISYLPPAASSEEVK